jgi:hypothetical protein
MNSGEAHEYYGWLAHEEGFFSEWRDEVGFRMIKMNVRESERESVRADLSQKVFEEMVKRKHNLEFKQIL